jgi:hypothetical protein
MGREGGLGGPGMGHEFNSMGNVGLGTAYGGVWVGA